MTVDIPRYTAEHMRAALKAIHPEQEYVTLFEVCESPGGAGRRADAIVLNLWPSRGFEIVGFEIKVSRSDWLEELKTPAKADAFFRYCDRWIVFAPFGVVKRPEVPKTWGLWELRDGGSIKRTVQPPHNIPEPMPRGLFMSLMRARAKLDKNEIEAIVAEASAAAYLRGRKSNAPAEGDSRQSFDAKTVERGMQKLAEIREATGIDLMDYHPAEHWIAKMKLADSKRITFALNSLLKLLTNDDLKAMVQTALEVSATNPDKKDADSW